MLLIDEVGYPQCADDAANVPYGVVDQRCRKRRPLICTTNKPLKRWGEVLNDPELAEALLDRVLERGEHIKLGGPSWRTKKTRKPGSDRHRRRFGVASALGGDRLQVCARRVEGHATSADRLSLPRVGLQLEGDGEIEAVTGAGPFF